MTQDTAEKKGLVSHRKVKILERACEILEEAKEKLV